MNRRTVVALIALVALSSGCGRSEKGSGRTDQARGKEAELPADFPGDVPILEGATVKLAISQGNRTVVHLYTPSPVAEAARSYADVFKARGWAVEDTMKTGAMSAFSARKGKSLCGVTVAREGRGTLVRLTLSQDAS